MLLEEINQEPNNILTVPIKQARCNLFVTEFVDNGLRMSILRVLIISVREAHLSDQGQYPLLSQLPDTTPSMGWCDSRS